jgi:hypothetical protein
MKAPPEAGHTALESAAPDVRESLRRLPNRRPVSSDEDGMPGVLWERIGFDRYEVRRDSTVIGYVDVVGAVFVAVAGARYARAVEVAQTLDFDRAIAALLEA